MLAKQISVFLENKPGQLANFIQMLADHHIDLQALSLAEAQEYGLVRIVVDKPEDTVALLKEQNWPCALTEVLSVLVPDKPGSLTKFSACSRKTASTSPTPTPSSRACRGMPASSCAWRTTSGPRRY